MNSVSRRDFLFLSSLSFLARNTPAFGQPFINISPEITSIDVNEENQTRFSEEMRRYFGFNYFSDISKELFEKIMEKGYTKVNLYHKKPSENVVEGTTIVSQKPELNLFLFKFLNDDFQNSLYNKSRFFLETFNELNKYRNISLINFENFRQSSNKKENEILLNSALNFLEYYDGIYSADLGKKINFFSQATSNPEEDKKRWALERKELLNFSDSKSHDNVLKRILENFTAQEQEKILQEQTKKVMQESVDFFGKIGFSVSLREYTNSRFSPTMRTKKLDMLLNENNDQVMSPLVLTLNESSFFMYFPKKGKDFELIPYELEFSSKEKEKEKGKGNETIQDKKRKEEELQKTSFNESCLSNFASLLFYYQIAPVQNLRESSAFIEKEKIIAPTPVLGYPSYPASQGYSLQNGYLR